MSKTKEQPKYAITVIVERSDQRGAKVKAKFEGIPASSAEAPDYKHAAEIALYRRFIADPDGCAAELNELQREMGEPT